MRAYGTNNGATTLADILERVLDKGVIIAGDIKINLLDIELLTIQIRLLVCSMEKAVEMGIDWWTIDKNLSTKVKLVNPLTGQGDKDLSIEEALQEQREEMLSLQKRLNMLESMKGVEKTSL